MATGVVSANIPTATGSVGGISLGGPPTGAGDIPPLGVAGDATTLLAPWLLGGLGDFLLQGIVLVMCNTYFTEYRHDVKEHRWFVFILNLFCVGKTIQGLMVLWDLFIVKFNTDPTTIITRMNLASITSPLTTSIIGLLVQLFFLRRLYLFFMGNWPRWAVAMLVVVAGLSAIMGVGGAIFLTHTLLNPAPIEVFDLAALQLFLLRSEQSIIIMLTGVMGTDAIVTAALILHLIMNKTGFSATDSMILRLVRVTWQSALPPTVCAAFNLIFYLVYGDGHPWHLMLNMFLPKLYAISAMYTLNARKAVRGPTVSTEYALSSSGGRNATTRSRVGTNAGVQIQTEHTTTTTRDQKLSPGQMELGTLRRERFVEKGGRDSSTTHSDPYKSDLDAQDDAKTYDLRWHQQP